MQLGDRGLGRFLALLGASPELQGHLGHWGRDLRVGTGGGPIQSLGCSVRLTVPWRRGLIHMQAKAG